MSDLAFKEVTTANKAGEYLFVIHRCHATLVLKPHIKRGYLAI